MLGVMQLWTEGSPEDSAGPCDEGEASLLDLL